MNVMRLPFALIAFLTFVALIPAWMYFLGEYATQLPPEAQFLAEFVLPATLLLTLASWVQPRGA